MSYSERESKTEFEEGTVRGETRPFIIIYDIPLRNIWHGDLLHFSQKCLARAPAQLGCADTVVGKGPILRVVARG